MELIGKQIAIETILGQPPELHYPSWYASQIEKLPPAPPEYLAEQAGILVTDSDTISRQAAIDALRKMQTYKLFSGDDMLLIDQAGAQTELMMLPPAQLSTNLAEVGTDCISRQAAIDFIDAGHLCNPNEPRWSDNEIVNFLKSRPSAQPEIVRCGDCKHWICHDRRCGYWNHGVKPLEWCCHAERKENR